MVTTAVFDVTTTVSVEFEGSWGAVAVMLTCPLFESGTTEGAVYTPTCRFVTEGTIVPTVEFPPAAPLTIQITAVLVLTVVFDRFTVAVILPVVLMPTLSAVGASTTEVTVALLLLLPPPQPIRPVSPATAINVNKTV
jgi:hypothetical protein